MSGKSRALWVGRAVAGFALVALAPCLPVAGQDGLEHFEKERAASPGRKLLRLPQRGGAQRLRKLAP